MCQDAEEAMASENVSRSNAAGDCRRDELLRQDDVGAAVVASAGSAAR